MNRELAQIAMTFLSRADLKGIEVDAFMRVCAALQEIINSPQEAVPANGEKA